MSAQHTPGPWKVVQAEHGIVVRTEAPTKTKYGASRYAAIGGFERSDPEQLAEAMANALLIAAAPELLEALIHIAGAAMDITCERKTIRDAACAAIAKATGGEV